MPTAFAEPEQTLHRYQEPVAPAERRSKDRIAVPFHAVVVGTDNEGVEFTIETVIDNLSSAGLYLRMMPRVEKGARLSVLLGLNTTSQVGDGAACFLIDGTVSRSEAKTGGVYGVAVAFDRAIFL